MAEPVIGDAIPAPGHDGQAVLLVRVRHDNGAIDTVTLDAEQAQKLLDICAAETLEELRGQPWRRLLHLLEPSTPSLPRRGQGEVASETRQPHPDPLFGKEREP